MLRIGLLVWQEIPSTTSDFFVVELSLTLWFWISFVMPRTSRLLTINLCGVESGSPQFCILHFAFKKRPASLQAYTYYILLRYGIVARAAPWVATRDALQGEPTTFEYAILAYCLDAILRAGRGEAARRRSQGRDTLLVEANQSDEW